LPGCVADLVQPLVSAAGDCLVDAVGLQHVREVESSLPALSGGVCLEVHLGRGNPRTDFVVRSLHRDRFELLRCTGPRLEPARRFARGWSAEAAGLENVPYVDLEFDLDGSGRSCFVVAMIEPELHRGMAAVPSPRQGSRWIGTSSSFEIAQAVLRAGEPSPVHARILDDVRRAFIALPHGGVIGHLGSLRCRQGDGEDLVRLIVSLPRRDLAAYLGALPWPGNLEAFLDALDHHLDRHARRVDFDLNFTATGLSSDTGFFRSMWNPRDDDVTGVASGLLRSGLATQVQADALIRFASHAGPPVEGIPWTMTFKTKVDAHGGLAAKAYLSLLATG
jgi:hypothetical protein